MGKLLRQEINEENREYYINEVNEPLVKLIQLYAMKFPKPARDGDKHKIVHPVSLRLLEIQERFLEFENNPRLRRLGEAIFRILIDKVEHSPNYRDRFSWLLEEFSEGMKARPYGHPLHDWNEPEPYGGGI
jgi:DNA/RNA-binding domain of Phe-tRNA-synthetase-like protein|tara:strand:- start:8237 stop:8629 length:393 start_codon:yes stop_codon:yes gene_type:complete